MSLVRRAIDTYRNEGLSHLGSAAGTYLYNSARDAYWKVRGTRTLTVGGVSATFSTAHDNEAVVVRKVLDLERPMLEDFLRELRTDDVFYDVGAHIGLYSCFAANVIDEGEVIAFEPYPPMRERLQRNAELNEGVRVLPIALSDSAGEVAFDNPTFDRERWSGKASIAPDPTDESISVETQRGDAVVDEEGVPPPTIVKIDVEGAEPLVVDGMTDLLSSDRCRLAYCEIHREADGYRRRSVADFGATVESVESSFGDLGFVTERIEDRPAEILLKARKPDEPRSRRGARSGVENRATKSAMDSS